MKVSELLQQMEDLFKESCGVELYAVMNKGDEKKIKRVNVADEMGSDDTTSEELKDGFIRILLSSLEEDDGEQDILRLSTADDRGKAVYYYDLDELPLEMNMMKMVVNASEPISVFNFNEDKLNEIIGFIVVIGDSNRKVALYKQQYPISLLKRDKYMLTPVPHANRLVKYDKDILRMDFQYQFMLWNDIVYVTDINKMEKICSFYHIIVNEAKKSIEEIKKIDILDNIEVLNDELDNIAFARKLTRVYKDSKVLGKVSNSDIIEFTQRHGYFRKNKIKLTEKGDKFILDTKKSKSTFVKLMNDDLLTSELTQMDYEALAKNNT